MSIPHNNLARISGLAALVMTATLIPPPHAHAQTANPPAVKLTTATTSDKTASVGIPDGWTLVRGANGFVYVTGPNDERVSLGAIVIAKDAPPSTPNPGGEVVFVTPFGTSLREKFTTIVLSGAAKQGLPKPELAFASETPTKLPMCTRLLGTSTSGPNAAKFEAIICSLKPDWLGLYKNIVFMLQVPSSRMAASRPIVEAIASSYRLTPDMFKKMLAPYTALPPRPSGGAPMPGLAPYQDPTNSDCFDYNVIRESPPWEVPMHCGGTKPG